MRRLLFLGSIFGIFFFTVVFLVTFFSPELVDRSARAFVVSQIEKEVSRHSAVFPLETVQKKISWLKDGYGDEIAAAKDQLSSGLRLKVSEILNQLCDVGCLRKKGIIVTDTTDEYLKERIEKLGAVSEKLTELVQGKYYRIISELLRDLRIFAGLNILLFLLIGSVSYCTTSLTRPLILPAGLLFVATVASIGIYIFGQNWFYALLFSDYMGWGYAAYVTVIFLFLIDIVFNDAAGWRAKICRRTEDWAKRCLFSIFPLLSHHGKIFSSCYESVLPMT